LSSPRNGDRTSIRRGAGGQEFLSDGVNPYCLAGERIADACQCGLFALRGEESVYEGVAACGGAVAPSVVPPELFSREAQSVIGETYEGMLIIGQADVT
jgi:hypothetical protein